jgi:hypothetical protein
MPYARSYIRRRPYRRRARWRGSSSYRSRRYRRADMHFIGAIIVLILVVWLLTSL